MQVSSDSTIIAHTVIKVSLNYVKIILTFKWFFWTFIYPYFCI